MTKNLEKLAEIGERKLLDDLGMNLIDIKQNLTDIRNIKHKILLIESLNKKIKIYNHLITTCKKYGVDVTEQEGIYSQITSDAKEYLKQPLSSLATGTPHCSEMEKLTN